jgi:hypothetical protein
MTKAFVRAVKISASFWRDPRGTTRRWRIEAGRVDVGPIEPGTFKPYLLPDLDAADVEAVRSATAANYD